ncbi:MAG: ribbon-helix-helix protein, CopG family [Gemmatimonadota bacterium]
MRTTIRLPDELLRQAKQLAAETDRTLTRVIEDALRETLGRRRDDRVATKSVKLTIVGRGTAFDDIDLDNTASLLDRMEGLG